jgi:rhombotail lipoprotein
MILSTAVALTIGCVPTSPVRMKSSSLDFLYPKGSVPAQPAAEVTLRLPLRVGLAFSPAQPSHRDAFSEVQKQKLLTGIAEEFRARDEIANIEVVPSSYLEEGGSFDNVDRLATALGLDLIALVSYDQMTFSESTRASWAYLTVIGPLFINGEKNETRTVMDAVIYDIPSRALLFRAAGESSVKGKSNPLTQAGKTRQLTEQGFEEATTSLIANLKMALDAFEEQAKEGSVRGPGTPALAMYDESGARVGSPGGGGAGAVGMLELVGALLLVGAVRRNRGPRGEHFI